MESRPKMMLMMTGLEYKSGIICAGDQQEWGGGKGEGGGV
jgi:hypothetical protein